MYLNPFVETQKDGTDSIILNNTNPEAYIRVSVPSHPLYGIEKNEEILERFSLLAEEHQNLFISRGYVSDKPFNRSQILKEVYHQVDSHKRFGLTIFPTLNCNCACSYCYQEHNNQPRMTEESYEAIYSLIQDKVAKGVRHISINLMGGEPTLEVKRFAPSMERCKKLCLESGVKFSGAITTNGILMDPVRLFSAGIDHFQVTLDGLPEIHEKLRPAANGSPTFQRILSNLLRIKSEDIAATCVIRTNHTKTSVQPEHLNRFLETLAQNFSGDSRFEIDHTFASDLGGNNDTSMLIPNNEREYLLEKLRTLTNDFGLATRLNRYMQNGGVCYAARSNHITIMPDLRVVKCTVALNDEINTVGQLLQDGTLQLNDNFHKWVSDCLTEEKCQKCSIAPICQARSCPLNRIKTGKNRCLRMPSAKYFIKEMSIRKSNLK
jgi:uncharacterized protein